MPTILLAGATGNLGHRIARQLLQRGATVKALVRPDSDPKKVEELAQAGVVPVRADLADAPALAKALEGVEGVVSAVQGLEEAIVTRQTQLLEAALAAGVRRFIPSDFATDFTRLEPGLNRNFDLRRRFMERLDAAPIRATSIMNGAFGEILTYGTPLLNFKDSSVGYWQDADFKADYTTMDDVAAYTAAASLDPEAPRLLRIASFQLSPADLARKAGQVTSRHFELRRLGSREDLKALIQRQRTAHPEGEQQVYPAWQQMQYQLGMITVHHEALDNDRYPGLTWTKPEVIIGLAARYAGK